MRSICFMAYPGTIDYQNPDYLPVWKWRLERLEWLRERPHMLRAIKEYYRLNPIDFIEDWGVTFDPRNLEIGRPTLMPMIPFPKQKEFLHWVMQLWRGRKSGLSDKSRDMGLTWLLASLQCTLALFNKGFVGGFGSRKADLVDKAGDPDSIFFKVRTFLMHVPVEFRGGWDDNNQSHQSYMKVFIPETGSVIRGEAGKNIGRGGRASMYVVDEAAHLEQPWSVETSLSATTNCRIDISSVNGMDNPFAEKRFSGRIDVMTLRWQDDPRKSQAWYENEVATKNPIVIAQEYDLDYSASKEGVLIPAAWINAAIDANIALGIPVSGDTSAGLDVADEGIDLNCLAAKKGVTLQHIEAWSGKGGTIYRTTMRAINLCDDLGIDHFYFDSDGLGVGVRGDAEVINELEARQGLAEVEAIPFHGSGKVVAPKATIIPRGGGTKKLTNEDFFSNRKAQGWWHLRTLFENTYKAVVEHLVVDLDEIISIPSTLPNRSILQSELSQPTYSINTAGKILVDKTPDGMKSPNYGDATMILYSPKDTRHGFF